MLLLVVIHLDNNYIQMKMMKRVAKIVIRRIIVITSSLKGDKKTLFKMDNKKLIISKI